MPKGLHTDFDAEGTLFRADLYYFLYICIMVVKGMKWYNTLQFIVLCLVFALVAVDWSVGLWAMVTLAVGTIVKIVAERCVGNPSLDTPLRVALLAVVAYWLCNVVSMLWSSNMNNAMDVVTRKAVMLIAPMCVLLSDTSYIKETHLRTLFYALLLAIGGLFVYDWITGTFEDKNHTYVAMYILPTAAFIYHELALRRRAMPLWQRLALYVAAVMTIVFIIYIDSRTGILCLYGIEVLCGVHLALNRKWWHGALLALLLVGLTFTAEKTLPNHNSRLPIASVAAPEPASVAEPTADTVAVVAPAYGKYSDARMAINETAVKCIVDKPVFGYGVGDYHDVLRERFGTEGYQSLKEHHLNAHNQYTETTLAIGVVGLLVMLFWLVMPLYIAWRRKAGFWEVLVLTFIVMFSLLFESILERQMGMQFVALLYAIMILIICRYEVSR